MNKKLIIISGVIMLLLILLIPKINRFLDIDQCLDGGGRWNHEKNICEHE
jgi:hypothetical protein